MEKIREEERNQIGPSPNNTMTETNFILLLIFAALLRAIGVPRWNCIAVLVCAAAYLIAKTLNV